MTAEGTPAKHDGTMAAEGTPAKQDAAEGTPAKHDVTVRNLVGEILYQGRRQSLLTVIGPTFIQGLPVFEHSGNILRGDANIPVGSEVTLLHEPWRLEVLNHQNIQAGTLRKLLALVQPSTFHYQRQRAARFPDEPGTCLVDLLQEHKQLSHLDLHGATELSSQQLVRLMAAHPDLLLQIGFSCVDGEQVLSCTSASGRFVEVLNTATAYRITLQMDDENPSRGGGRSRRVIRITTRDADDMPRLPICQTRCGAFVLLSDNAPFWLRTKVFWQLTLRDSD